MERGNSEKITQITLNAVSNQSSTFKSPSKSKKALKSYKRWTHDENTTYALFLLKHQEDFCSEWNRRSKRVYRRLSKLIETKSTSQCKSHHQKMLKYCGTLQKIIEKYLIQRQPPGQQLAHAFPFMHPFFFPPGAVIKSQDQNSHYVKMQPEELYINYANLQQKMLACPEIKQEQVKREENVGEQIAKIEQF